MACTRACIVCGCCPCSGRDLGPSGDAPCCVREAPTCTHLVLVGSLPRPPCWCAGLWRLRWESRRGARPAPLRRERCCATSAMFQGWARPAWCWGRRLGGLCLKHSVAAAGLRGHMRRPLLLAPHIHVRPATPCLLIRLFLLPLKRTAPAGGVLAAHCPAAAPPLPLTMQPCTARLSVGRRAAAHAGRWQEVACPCHRFWFGGAHMWVLPSTPPSAITSCFLAAASQWCHWQPALCPWLTPPCLLSVHHFQCTPVL
jgi:hypothetical protein